ncbi:tetratricopeptide repeat protein [Actinomadura luteofluorescens]|uniref:tetratricopeptide repeat protein n=1 Tax=Actinomadura luteofluorescens TaxID=46163 RepID=UPI0030D41491
MLEQSQNGTPDPLVAIGIEVPKAGAFDDLVLYRGRVHTHCQIKYSVDASRPVSSEMLVGRNGRSLLKTLAASWHTLREAGQPFDLAFITARAIDHNDPLLAGIDMRTGCLMPAAANGSSRSARGKARSEWAAVAGLSEEELLEFLSSLTFETSLTPPRLEDESLQLMRTLGLPSDRAALNAGVGWVQSRVINSRRIIRHADILEACRETWPDFSYSTDLGQRRELVLQIAQKATTLLRPGRNTLTHVHPGVTATLEDLLWRLPHGRDEDADSPDLATLVGVELGKVFLPEPLAMALAEEIEIAEHLNTALHLALDVHDELAHLPWETLTQPGDPIPLALHPKVRLYRRALERAVARSTWIPGPLRVLAIMASPAGQVLLDYEAEQNRILEALSAARDEGAYVRFLNSGTLEELSRALNQERFHILHISCHATAGTLYLEDDLGQSMQVNAERVATTILHADRTPALVSLSGCGTALGGSTENLARVLTMKGVPMVLATTGPISDQYATRFTSELYRALCDYETPDVLTAFCDTRRTLEEARSGKELSEWAVLALFVRGPVEPLFRKRTRPREVANENPLYFPDNIRPCPLGEFVGRRADMRVLRRELQGEHRGIVIHGLGGTGKTCLAARLLEEGDKKAIIVALSGQTTPSSILKEIGEALYEPAADERHRELARYLRRTDEPWTERLSILKRRVLGSRRILLFLDQFDPNLRKTKRGWKVADADLADFVSGWTRSPGLHRVLFTSRQPFRLPEKTEELLFRHHLGALSRPETLKLIWRLRGLNQLGSDAIETLVTRIGGHPRTLEFLDTLLTGKPRFDDIQKLMRRLGSSERQSDIESAIDTAIELTVNDIALGQLIRSLDDASRDILIGGSVHRSPVDGHTLAWASLFRHEGVPSYLDSDRRAGPEFRGSVGFTIKITGFQDLPEDHFVRPSDFDMITAWKLFSSQRFKKTLKKLEESGLITPAFDASVPYIYSVLPWVGEAVAQGQERTWAHWAAAESFLSKGELAGENYPQITTLWQEAAFHLRRAGKPDQAIQLIESTARRLILEGELEEAAQVCRASLTDVLNRADDRATLHTTLGEIAQRRAEWNEALEQYAHVLKISREKDDLEGVAIALQHSGTVHEQLGELDEAYDRYIQALEILEEKGSVYQVAAATAQLGSILFKRGDAAAASAYYAQAMDAAEELGDHSLITTILHSKSILAQESGDWDTAASGYETCLSMARELGDRFLVAGSLHQLGVLALLRGNLKPALKYAREAFSLAGKLDDVVGAGVSLGLIGAVYEKSQEYGLAVGYTLRSLVALTTDAGDPLPEAANAVQRLADQRRTLGTDRFDDALTVWTDPASADWINRLLDLHESQHDRGRRGRP